MERPSTLKVITAMKWLNVGKTFLEFDIFENDAHWKNLSFENLERFKVSMGGSLNEDYDFITRKHSFENTLKLVTQKGELMGSRINELFEKTVVLCLSVDDMNDLEDVEVKSSLHPQSSSVAKTLSNLEYLKVCDCPVMKELIHNGDRGEETITFPKLKLLLLSGLPELLDLCQNVNIIALPQLKELRISGIPNITSVYSKNKLATSCSLKEDVLVPKLEKLYIEHMGGLEEIWPCDFRTSEKVKLREIEVVECENLVNIFPCNPMPLLCELEGFKVKDSGSVESLFNIDLDCIGETGEGGNINSLRNIEVEKLRKLREVWRIKGGENNSCLPIRCFQVVESISIESCKRFRNFLSPITTDFDLGALIYMKIDDSDGIRRKYGSVESSSGQENTLFPSCLTHSFHNLHNLKLGRYLGVEVIFEIKSTPTSQDNQQHILPYLENLEISDMEGMSHCIGGGGAKTGNNEISFSSTITNTSFLHQYKGFLYAFPSPPLMSFSKASLDNQYHHQPDITLRRKTWWWVFLLAGGVSPNDAFYSYIPFNRHLFFFAAYSP
ncbi:unnamed protein product [Lactuca saligna]|uniref:Disease resistance protein At4g27190-like leucine-rich repeats domain-containing protein n=1 Tax=Lactuca saligna TaxID=75948 RepID=A0AA35YCN5_LACSI|nr:unnamed protein product [Lactuca saligna]